MSVELVPAELGFQKPFTREVTQTLHLRNPNRDPVAFKVKTTAPKQYCVRPNSGRIEAGMEVEVQVLLQAMKEDPPPEAKCRDKFLVQTVAITADREFSNVAAIWQHVEQTAKSSVQEKKIRVLWIPASGHLITPSHHNSVNGHRETTPFSEGNTTVFRSPSPENHTPSHTSTTPVGTSIKPSAAQDEEPLTSGNDISSSSVHPATTGLSRAVAPVTSKVSSLAANVAKATPTTAEELKAQLAEAKATIARLTSQATDNGLRQRKTEKVAEDARERLTTGTTGGGVQQQTGRGAVQEGVPVQIVAALCLLSFVVAYLLF